MHELHCFNACLVLCITIYLHIMIALSLPFLFWLFPLPFIISMYFLIYVFIHLSVYTFIYCAFSTIVSSFVTFIIILLSSILFNYLLCSFFLLLRCLCLYFAFSFILGNYKFCLPEILFSLFSLHHNLLFCPMLFFVLNPTHLISLLENF